MFGKSFQHLVHIYCINNGIHLSFSLKLGVGESKIGPIDVSSFFIFIYRKVPKFSDARKLFCYFH